MTTTAEPPAEAVAKDAHWAAKMQRLRDRKPLSAIVTYLDDETADVVREKRRDVNRARTRARARLAKDLEVDAGDVDPEAIEADEGVQAALGDLNEAEEAHDAANVALELQGLPEDVYEELIGEHPPTPEQLEAGQMYNADRFAPALVSACCTDPMTPKDAAEIIGGEYEVLAKRGKPTGKWKRVQGSLTFGEAKYLFDSARQCNENARVSLGKGSGPTQT